MVEQIVFRLLPQQQTAKLSTSFNFSVNHFHINFYLFFKSGALSHTVLDLGFLSLHLMTRIYLNKIFDPLIFIYLQKKFTCP